MYPIDAVSSAHLGPSKVEAAHLALNKGDRARQEVC
jgi:hypothetical protein